MGGGGTNQKPEGGERKGAGTGSCGPCGDRDPARGDNARPRKEGDAQAPGMRVTFQPHTGGGQSGGHRKWARRGGIRTGRFAVLE